MQQRQAAAGGLMRSALSKARGHALRLALNLQLLWWCSDDDMPPPAQIRKRAFAAAAHLVGDYFVPMAERVYGDAAATAADRNAATLARWILAARTKDGKHLEEMHVRTVQREARLPGLRTADDIKAAAAVLVDADWLRPPPSKGGFVAGWAREVYAINPRLWEVAP